MTIKTGLHPFTGLFLLIIAIYSPLANTAPSAAMGYTPKYPANFKNFDYVNPEAKKGGTIVLSGRGAFNSFNPFLLKGMGAEGLGLLFDTLMVRSLDEPFSKYPLIANDIELAADKLSVKFKIDKRARFTNGDNITAYDVKFSFDTIMSDKGHPQFKFFYGDVKDAVVINTQTIKFNFKKEKFRVASYIR